MMKRVFGILLAAALLLGAAAAARRRGRSRRRSRCVEPQSVVPDHGKGSLRRAGDGDDDLQKADELRGRDLPVAREHPGYEMTFFTDKVTVQYGDLSFDFTPDSVPARPPPR